eukprot:2431321-Prymnesium_polylepis.1
MSRSGLVLRRPKIGARVSSFAEFLRRRPEFVSSAQNWGGAFASPAGRPESALQHLKTIHSN